MNLFYANIFFLQFYRILAMLKVGIASCIKESRQTFLKIKESGSILIGLWNPSMLLEDVFDLSWKNI